MNLSTTGPTPRGVAQEKILQWTRSIFVETSPRPISIGQLHTLLRFHIRPINPVVYRGPYQIHSVGALILKRASRLDAFSGYHFPT